MHSSFRPTHSSPIAASSLHPPSTRAQVFAFKKTSGTEDVQIEIGLILSLTQASPGKFLFLQVFHHFLPQRRELGYWEGGSVGKVLAAKHEGESSISQDPIKNSQALQPTFIAPPLGR